MYDNILSSENIIICGIIVEDSKSSVRVCLYKKLVGLIKK